MDKLAECLSEGEENENRHLKLLLLGLLLAFQQMIPHLLSPGVLLCLCSNNRPFTVVQHMTQSTAPILRELSLLHDFLFSLGKPTEQQL